VITHTRKAKPQAKPAAKEDSQDSDSVDEESDKEFGWPVKAAIENPDVDMEDEEDK
jgi:hypothetical protein